MEQCCGCPATGDRPIIGAAVAVAVDDHISDYICPYMVTYLLKCRSAPSLRGQCWLQKAVLLIHFSLVFGQMLGCSEQVQRRVSQQHRLRQEPEVMAAGGDGLAPCLKWSLADTPMSCAVSPATSHLAVGLVTGELEVFSYSHDAANQQKPFSVQQVFSVTAHGADQSCRAAAFSLDGAYVISGGQSRKLIATAVKNHKQVWCQDAAHDSAVSLLRVLPGGGAAGSSIVVSGDEDGGLKVWDMRARKQVMGYKKHTDYISDAVLHAREMALVVTSGDGTLSVHDIRTSRFRARSESDADDEMLSAAVVKGGKKVVCGCGSGVLAIYSWGYFNDCSDRFPGHPESVDALLGFDDDTIITGSSDGMLRVLNVLPNKLLGVIGSHDEFPVEAMAMSSDRRVLASICHDACVRLWDLGVLHDDGEGEDEEGEHEQQEEVEGGDEEVGSEGEAVGAADGQEEVEDSEQEEEESDEDHHHPGIGVRAPAASSKHGRSSEEGGSEDGSDAAPSSSGEEEDDDKGRQQQQHASKGGAGSSAQQAKAAAASNIKGGSSSLGGQRGVGKGGSTAVQQAGDSQQAAPAQQQQQQKQHQPGSKLDKQFAKLQPVRGGSKAGSEGDGEEDEDDSSDEDAPKGKKLKRRQRERTRWTQGKEKKTQKKNFFSDLL